MPNHKSKQRSNPPSNHPPHHPDFPAGPYPIIFIRGFALGENAIQDTTATPFMGFNLGSTKHRQLWTGELTRIHFASPLIRLMEDYGYTAVDLDPFHTHAPHPHPPKTHSPNTRPLQPLSPRSILIHRYYDRADPDFVSLNPNTDHPDHPDDQKPPTILQAAHDLKTLIDLLKERIDPSHPFGVHLVAHSMGGLIARCLLQHPDLKHTKAAQAVNKVFTYATPHGGIAIRGLELPRFIQRQHINHFNRTSLSNLFQSPTADDLNNDFPVKRFFSLIGTNHRDYDAGRGLAKHLAGPQSDGLVQIRRAAVKHTPRAHIHRTHGGPLGIVNSEGGYENLVRFLFARYRLDAHLEVHALPLPKAIQAAKDQGHRINASYWFEASLAPRPNPRQGQRAPVYLTERRKANHSSIFRAYDELMAPKPTARPTTRPTASATSPLNTPSNTHSATDPHQPPPRLRHPVLCSVFLDPAHSADDEHMVLSLELAISATDYAIDGEIHPEYSLAGQYLYQDTLKLTFSPSHTYDMPADDTPANDTHSDDTDSDDTYSDHSHAHDTPAKDPTNPIPWQLTVASIAEPWAPPLAVQPVPNPNTASQVDSAGFKVGLYRGPVNPGQTQRSIQDSAFQAPVHASHDHRFRGDLVLTLSKR